MKFANECSATELVALLTENGVSMREIEKLAGIDRGMLSRIRAGMRTNEEHWRTLADLAVSAQLVKWPPNPEE